MAVLKEARQAVPAVNYALGLAGIAGAAAIIAIFVGDGEAAVRIMFLMFLGMVLLYLFSVFLEVPSLRLPGIVLIWAVVIAFVFFITVTMTAFALEKPCAWVRFLKLQSVECQVDALQPARTVRFEGELQLLQQAISTRHSELNWLLHLRSPELTRFYVSEITARDWRALTQAVCRSLVCVDCDERSASSDISMALIGPSDDWEIEGVAYKKCRLDNDG